MFHVCIRARQNNGRLKRELCLGVYETMDEALAKANEHTFSYIVTNCPHCKEKEQCNSTKDN